MEKFSELGACLGCATICASCFRAFVRSRRCGLRSSETKTLHQRRRSMCDSDTICHCDVTLMCIPFLINSNSLNCFKYAYFAVHRFTVCMTVIKLNFLEIKNYRSSDQFDLSREKRVGRHLTKHGRACDDSKFEVQILKFNIDIILFLHTKSYQSAAIWA